MSSVVAKTMISVRHSRSELARGAMQWKMTHMRAFLLYVRSRHVM